MNEIKEPTVTQERTGQCDPHEVFNHDAFGTVTMTVTRGGDSTLFGSDLGHGDRVCIKVQRAERKRNLNRDWIHGDCRPMVEFEMSHAQFAQFITSQGNGSGTPCTLRQAPERGTSIREMPGIKNIETKHETFRREIADASRKRLEAIKRKVDELGDLIESGKLPKSQLRELHKELHREASYLPGTMEFVVKSAEEALEKATSDAKIEVESYIAMSAQRIGLKHISQLAQLENKPASAGTPCERGEHTFSRSMNQEYPRRCVYCDTPEKA